jgi:O-antigen ligase
MAWHRGRGSGEASARRGSPVDVLGLVLGASAVVWTIVASLGRAARPAPVVWLIVLCGALVVVGRRVARGDAATVPGGVAAAVSGAVVMSYPSILKAGGAPTGYANSNACLIGLGAIGAAAAAASSRRAPTRRAWAALAVLLAIGVVATGSVAASLALAVVALLAAASVLRRQVAAVGVGGVVAASIAVGLTVAIAAGGDPLGLSERAGLRADLWSRALDQLHAEPLRGGGPGSYSGAIPLTIDRDLRWAHHGYLQQAAEQGLVGLVLLISLVGWGYARLWSGRRRASARTTAGAAALTLVALHASVDHVLHDAAVPLTLAVLLGWATADRSDQESRGSPRPPR